MYSLLFVLCLILWIAKIQLISVKQEDINNKFVENREA